MNMFVCVSVCSETKMKQSAFKHSIAWVCVLCEARCEYVQIKQFHMKNPLAGFPNSS